MTVKEGGEGGRKPDLAVLDTVQSVVRVMTRTRAHTGCARAQPVSLSFFFLHKISINRVDDKEVHVELTRPVGPPEREEPGEPPLRRGWVGAAVAAVVAAIRRRRQQRRRAGVAGDAGRVVVVVVVVAAVGRGDLLLGGRPAQAPVLGVPQLVPQQGLGLERQGLGRGVLVGGRRLRPAIKKKDRGDER